MMAQRRRWGGEGAGRMLEVAKPVVASPPHVSPRREAAIPERDLTHLMPHAQVLAEEGHGGGAAALDHLEQRVFAHWPSASAL